MKKILVATDLSSRSDRAVLRAVKLAKELEAKLIIVHTIDNETERGLIEDVKESAKKEINICLKNKIKNLKPEIKICVGSAFSEILKTATEEDVDLIVLGLHRHTDADHPMIGNVIERLLELSHKPLLVVKDRHEEDYTKILVALDFNTPAKRSLKTAFELFSSGQFHLLHTYMVPFLGFMGHDAQIEHQISSNCLENLNEVVDDLLKNEESDKKEQYKINKIVKKGSVLDVIKKEVPYLKPDLLVFGNHSRHGFARSIVKSSADIILLNPPCDVLVVS
ncbi:MAG: nucleotide-binding universal stress UspA family protein [Rickettsiales bacterium]|jgi:nucleotide-binding universal stress UspA family protein